MILELLGTIAVSLLTIWFYTFYYYYKPLKNVASPKVWPIVGSALEFKNPEEVIHVFIKMMKEFNTNNLRVHLGFKALLVTKDYKVLEHILNSQREGLLNKGYKNFEPWLGKGLFTNGGEPWRKHRKMITPTFHFQILEQFIDVFNSNCEILINKMRKQIGQPGFDIYPFMTLCALDIICETAMGTSVNAQSEETSEYAQAVKEIGRVIQTRGFKPYLHIDFIYKFTKLYREQQAVLQILNGHIDNVIEARHKKLLEEKSSGKTLGTDELGRKKKVPFLDMLLQSTIDGKPLTNQIIRDEVSTFMFAGHDTSAGAMSFAIYCLANYPEVQEKAFKEIHDIFGNDKTRECTYSDLQQMKYLDLVIKETLRMYPPAPLFSRRPTEDVVFDGFTIPKDMAIIFLPFGIHYDPEYFPEPKKFKPERFSTDNYDGRKPFCFIPFSAGPRNCIGQKYAMMEMKTILSTILRNFEILPATPKHTVKLASAIILRAVNGIKISLKERQY